MKQAGVVKWYDRKKGFGFITSTSKSTSPCLLRPASPGEELFVHMRDIETTGGRPFLDEGYEVEFVVAEFEGRRTASNVTLPSGKPVEGATSSRRGRKCTLTHTRMQGFGESSVAQ